jgi:hypothetical protein
MAERLILLIKLFLEDWFNNIAWFVTHVMLSGIIIIAVLILLSIAFVKLRKKVRRAKRKLTNLITRVTCKHDDYEVLSSELKCCSGMYYEVNEIRCNKCGYEGEVINEVNPIYYVKRKEK